MREADVQNLIRLEAAQFGLILWRNNSGVLRDASGRPVRFGLGNDSSAVNKKIKSSDLIGLWQGRFVAIECKPTGWKYCGNSREIAQFNYIKLVRKHGGIACFATSWEDVHAELTKNSAA